MPQSAAPSVPKPPPLFTLELSQNGGRLAPTSFQELIRWIDTELANWSWTSQRNYGNHEQGVRECFSQLAQALDHVGQAERHSASNPQASKDHLEACRGALEDVYVRRKFPHSTTPLGTRIANYQKETGNEAAGYFSGALVPPRNGLVQLQPSSLDAWRCTFDGIVERFGLVRGHVKGRQQAADESFEQLRVKAESLVSDKTATYDALHRDYSDLAQSIRDAALSQAQTFTEAQTIREAEFAELKAKHEAGLDGLRRMFKEEIALRAPADYWEKKRAGHRKWSWVTGVLSFAGIAIGAGALGWHIHDLLQDMPANSMPQPWRVASLALVAVFTIWGLRLLVRMFLSHLHLLTDAGERVVMVQTYLSLLEGDRLANKEDRHLILQALFRPASDGIVKDEGVPFSLAEVLTRQGRP
jgi:hypothetical protein